MTIELRNLPSRKQRRKHLQHRVQHVRQIKDSSNRVIGLRYTQNDHANTKPEDRPFPEAVDYHRPYVRPLMGKLPWIRKSIVERRNRIPIRTAAEIVLSGVNYTPIMTPLVKRRLKKKE